MGFFGKLFGRKELDKDLAELEKTPLEEPFPEEPLGLKEKPLFPETDFSRPEEPAFLTARGTEISPRDMELLNSKLDTIRAMLGSLEQRMANLEKVLGAEQKRMPW